MEDERNEEHSSSDHYRRSRRDLRQCKLAPDENSFNLRKSRMKARVQKEQKLRDSREATQKAVEAQKRRSNSRRDHDDDEIEESGTTEDFNSSDSHYGKHKEESPSDENKDDVEVVPFAAAEPLTQPSNSPQESQSASEVTSATPNGTVSASSAEVLSREGGGRRQESSSNDSSEDRIEDASVLSLGAEATPIHDHHQQDQTDSSESDYQERREHQSNERRRPSSEIKSRQRVSRKCKIITATGFVALFGVAGAFFAIRNNATPSFSIPAKQISQTPTFAPTFEASARKTEPPTQELVYEPPTPEECEIVRRGGRLEDEDGLRVSRYNVELDVELAPTATMEDVFDAITNATKQILIPDLVGCFGAHRTHVTHFQFRRSMTKPSQRYNPNRYAIANGNSTIRPAVGRNCKSGSGGPCSGIDVILHLAAKNAGEKRFVFQSLIIEIFGRDDLAASLDLGAVLKSIKLSDVKINAETNAPSELPTSITTVLSIVPSDLPSLTPSIAATSSPTVAPTQMPTLDPTISPSQSPSHLSSSTPTTGMPSSYPSASPTRARSETPSVSLNPTVSPSVTTSSVAPTMTRNTTDMPTKKTNLY